MKKTNSIISPELTSINRCAWSGQDPLYIHYHDTEWGVPVHDDRKLFEFITLEGAQAGLSWLTVLKKRENYREAFEQFDVEKIALFSPKKIASLMQNPGIIRNRLKIESTVRNAQAFLKIVETFGSFDAYQWQWVEGRPLQNKLKSMKDIPARSNISGAWSKDLKKRGFNFVGSTILYAHMQATGMVNDHLTSCFRYPQLTSKIIL